jgi:hypothetical protein
MTQRGSIRIVPDIHACNVLQSISSFLLLYLIPITPPFAQFLVDLIMLFSHLYNVHWSYSPPSTLTFHPPPSIDSPPPQSAHLLQSCNFIIFFQVLILSAQEQKHTKFVFLSLSYLTQHDSLQFHPFDEIVFVNSCSYFLSNWGPILITLSVISYVFLE